MQEQDPQAQGRGDNRALRAREAYVAGRDAHLPTQRLLAVLRVLRQQAGETVATSTLHNRLDCYGDDEAGRKRLQRDLPRATTVLTLED